MNDNDYNFVLNALERATQDLSQGREAKDETIRRLQITAGILSDNKSRVGQLEQQVKLLWEVLYKLHPLSSTDSNHPLYKAKRGIEGVSPIRFREEDE